MNNGIVFNKIENIKPAIEEFLDMKMRQAKNEKKDVVGIYFNGDVAGRLWEESFRFSNNKPIMTIETGTGFFCTLKGIPACVNQNLGCGEVCVVLKKKDGPLSEHEIIDVYKKIPKKLTQKD